MVIPLTEVENALREILFHQKILVEGDAAVSFAGARRLLRSGKARKVVAILSGGNLAEGELNRITGK